MNENHIRDIYYYKSFYLDFFATLKPDAKRKFNWTLKLIATVDKVPVKYFKHMENTTGLFEVRVEVGSDIYRVFSFFDEGTTYHIAERFSKEISENAKK